MFVQPGDFFWIAFGAFLLVATLVVATVLTGFKPTLGFLKGMSGYAGLFAFGVAVILVINHLDKKTIAEIRIITPSNSVRQHFNKALP